MLKYYKLDAERNLILCSLEEWIEVYEKYENNVGRIVGEDTIDGYLVLTCFLGIDTGIVENAMLFETMIFGPRLPEGYQTRCRTWDEAVEMHQNAIQWIKNGWKGLREAIDEACL